MKRFFTIVIALIMLIGVMPFGTVEVFAADTGNVVYVNGKKMSSGVTRIKCGDGYADYDAATNTLHLENCLITQTYYDDLTGYYSGIYSDAALNIELAGTNNLSISSNAKTTVCGIYASQGITLGGGGRLFVYAHSNKFHDYSYGIYTEGDLYFGDCLVYTKCDDGQQSSAGAKCDRFYRTGTSEGSIHSLFAAYNSIEGLSCNGVSNCDGCTYYTTDDALFKLIEKQSVYTRHKPFFVCVPNEASSTENPWYITSADELSLLLQLSLDSPVYLQLQNDIKQERWYPVDIYGSKILDLNGFDIYGNLNHYYSQHSTLEKASMFTICKNSSLTVNDSTGNNGEVFYNCYIPDVEEHNGLQYETIFYHKYSSLEQGSMHRDLFCLDDVSSNLIINGGIFKAGRKKSQYSSEKACYIDALFLGSIVTGSGSFTSNGGIYTFNKANNFNELSADNKVIINDGIFTCKSHDSNGLFFQSTGSLYGYSSYSEDAVNHITLNGGKFISQKLGTNDPNGTTDHGVAELHIREDYFEFKNNAWYFYNNIGITEYTDDLLNKRGTFEIKPKINGTLTIAAPQNAEQYNGEYYYAQNSSFVITPTAFGKFYTDGVCSELEHTYYEYTVTDTANPAVTYTTNTSVATFDLGSISPSRFTFEKGHTYSVKCTYNDYYQGTCKFDLTKESENEILIHISGATLPRVTAHSVEATFYRSSSADTKRGMATLTVSDCGDFEGGSCELLFYPKSSSYASISQPITGDGRYVFNFTSDSNGVETYAYEIKMFDKNGYPTFSSRETFKGLTGPWIYISSGYSKPLIDGQRYVMAGSSLTLKTEQSLNVVSYQWYKRARNADGSYASSSEAVSGGTSNTLSVTAPGKYYLRIFSGSYYAYSNVITVDTAATTSDLCVIISSSADSCSKTSPATLTAATYNVNTSKQVYYEWTITKAPDGFGSARPHIVGDKSSYTFPSPHADLAAYPPGIYEFTCKITNDGKSYTSVPVKVELTKAVERIETYYNDTAFTDGDTLYMPSQEKSITVFSASYPREITGGYNISYKVSEGNSVKVTGDSKSCAVITPVHPGTSKIKVYIKAQDGHELCAASTITVVVPVSVVDVYINQPMVKGGTLENSDISVDSSYFSSVNKYWYIGGSTASALADGTVIQANKRYSAGVKLTLKSGYYLPTKNAKTANPQSDAVGTTDCIKIRWHTDTENPSRYTERIYDGPSSGTSYYIYEIFDFDTVKDKSCAYFDEIECRFISPDAGTPANALGSCFIFNSSNFRQSAAIIWDETAGRRLVTGSTAFIEGHTYSASLCFGTTGEDMYFDDSPSVTINGQPFGAQLSFNSSTPNVIEVTENLTFTCGVKEYDYIYNVSLSGVETPVAGAKAPLLNNVTDDGTISVDTDKLYVTKAEWYSNGTDWNDFLDGSYFKPNTAYKARIWFEVNTDDYPTYRLCKVNSTPWLKVCGQYYKTTFVNGTQTKGYVDVVFPATGGLEGISVAGSTQRVWNYKEGCFTAAEAAASAYTVNLVNHSANEYGGISVEYVSGDAGCFTVNQPNKTVLHAYESASFTVVPKHDLAGGVYQARYQLSYDGGEPIQFTFGINVEDRDWNYLSGLMYLDVENKDDYDYMKLITVTLTPQGETEPVITQSFVGFDAQPYSISNITPGIYTLKAEHEGSATYEQTVDITTDAEHNIYMPLAGGAGNSIFGVVSYCGSDDSPLVFSYKRSAGGKAQIKEFSTEAENYNYTAARKALNYCLTEIGFAQYTIVVSKTEHVDRRIVVSVTSDTTLTMSLNKTYDVNGDCVTDVADYSAGVNYALSADPSVNPDQTDDAEYEKRVADIDGDGFVDVLDVVLLERKINI